MNSTVLRFDVNTTLMKPSIGVLGDIGCANFVSGVSVVMASPDPVPETK